MPSGSPVLCKGLSISSLCVCVKVVFLMPALGKGHHTGLTAGRACSYQVPPRPPNMSQLALPAHKGWGEHEPPTPGVLRRDCGDHSVGGKSPGPEDGFPEAQMYQSIREHVQNPKFTKSPV